MAKRREPVTAEQRRERWRQAVRQWRSSGLSQAEFCRREGLRYSQFAWWKRRLGDQAAGRQRRGTPPSRGPAALLPLGTVRLASSPRLEVVLLNGRRLRFGPELPPERLADLVAVLDGPAVEDQSC